MLLGLIGIFPNGLFNMTHRELALKIATEAHAGQKRKDGKDYITHPIAVEKIALSLAKELYSDLSEAEMDLISSMALLHDVEEDTNLTLEDINKEFVKRGFFELFSITELNKNNYASYKNYIVAISRSTFYVRIVKKADLLHNLSDLKPGSLRDKYELALHIIDSTFKQRD